MASLLVVIGKTPFIIKLIVQNILHITIMLGSWKARRL
jgi:hypothetical protein